MKMIPLYLLEIIIASAAASSWITAFFLYINTASDAGHRIAGRTMWIMFAVLVVTAMFAGASF